jgi:hypothetical protein
LFLLPLEHLKISEIHALREILLLGEIQDENERKMKNKPDPEHFKLCIYATKLCRVPQSCETIPLRKAVRDVH